jgi:protein tyrosine phosphatase (PTP) superfamily phosphohydrolase (DUF442 family)
MTIRSILPFLAKVAFALVMFLALYEHHQVNELERYRRSDDPFQRGLMAYTPSREGLDDLHISGSARPTKNGLQLALSSIDMPVYIMDFFAKNHYYIDGLPEDWLGYKRSRLGVNAKRGSFRGKIHRLIYTGKLQHDASDTQTEQEMVADLGLKYVLVDQVRKALPSPEQVDEFIQIVDTLPNPVWVHFHCSAGRGRTTIAMVMYDILKNGKKVSVEDIVMRHHLQGSENLFNTVVWPNGRYTKEMLEERKQFIIAFHKYVNSPDGWGVQTWTQWIGTKG